MSIAQLKNETTGELAPAHNIGTDEHGNTLYAHVDGWVPADAEGNPVAYQCDHDGNSSN